MNMLNTIFRYIAAPIQSWKSSLLCNQYFVIYLPANITKCSKQNPQIVSRNYRKIQQEKKRFLSQRKMAFPPSNKKLVITFVQSTVSGLLLALVLQSLPLAKSSKLQPNCNVVSKAQCRIFYFILIWYQPIRFEYFWWDIQNWFQILHVMGLSMWKEPVKITSGLNVGLEKQIGRWFLSFKNWFIFSKPPPVQNLWLFWLLLYMDTQK